MDTHTLSLTACTWRLLCDMPCAQGSGDGVGTLADRLLGCHRFFHRFCAHLCATLEHLCLKHHIPEKSAEKSAHCAPKICAKICAQNFYAKNLRKSLRKYQRTKIIAKIVPRTGVKNPSLWKMKTRKKKHTQQRSAPNLCKTPTPNKVLLRPFLQRNLLASCESSEGVRLSRERG